MKVAHSLKAEDVLSLLKSSPQGLSEEEARKRLELYGRNEIELKREGALSIFIGQFKNPLIYLLLGASAVTLAFGNLFDFFLITGIVFVNATLGFVQEYKARTSLESLRRITELTAKVVRDGSVKEVPSSLVVPGDIVIVEEGDVVPADMRLLESRGLMVDEATLTGESVPVEKEADPVLEEDTPPYERKNVLFKGTIVVRGRGKGVVYVTGPNTELGKISLRAGESSPDTPLMRALQSFSKKWMFVLLLLMLLLFSVGVLQGRSLYEVGMLVIAELVSAVPEGLPIAVTLVLVVGALRLARRKTYIRYLAAAEALGSTTYIATDKTGTITEGRLKVKDVYEVEPEFLRLVSALCNNAELGRGDPLEVALLKWLEEGGYPWREVRESCPRLAEYPFDTRKRYMATINDCMGKRLLLIKGALETLLSLTDEPLEDLKRKHEGMARRGLRVLAFGYAEVEDDLVEPEKTKIKIAGLVGFIDPPKEGVREAVAFARGAGIRVVMLTGDNLETAKAVAREVGIYVDGDWALEGKQLQAYSDEELYSVLKRLTVVARALPEDKYRIVRVLQSRGEIVAVTGDGVNDVPALKVADIGVAMGSGSQAAKDVAKMVITDNNLKVIVEAIELGRRIARNIRRTIHYLLSASFGEVFLISSSFFLGLPLPLHPVQILWMNLVTHGVQDKAFPFNGEEEDLMRERPRRPERVFFDREQVITTLSTALFTGGVNLYLFLWLLERVNYEVAVSTVFTSMVVNQWVIGLQTVRDKPFLYRPWRNFTLNPYIFAGVLLGLLLQLLVLYIFPEYIHAYPLSLSEWIPVALTSVAVFLFIEIRKVLFLILGKAGSTSGEA